MVARQVCFKRIEEKMTSYLIDNKAGIIVDAEGTRANRAAEIAITETMIDRIKRRFDLRPQRLAGDSVYGAVRVLRWLVDRQIAPHVPVWDKPARHDGTWDVMLRVLFLASPVAQPEGKGLLREIIKLLDELQERDESKRKADVFEREDKQWQDSDRELELA
jgi:hypothetical protein